jgi:hypothetical protein
MSCCPLWCTRDFGACGTTARRQRSRVRSATRIGIDLASTRGRVRLSEMFDQKEW